MVYMKKNERKTIRRDWTMGVILLFIGFFVNILATAAYDLIIDFENGSRLKVVITIVSFILSLFFTTFFTYIIDVAPKKDKNDINLREDLKSYFKYVWASVRKYF